jgi:hypothetical protein
VKKQQRNTLFKSCRKVLTEIEIDLDTEGEPNAHVIERGLQTLEAAIDEIRVAIHVKKKKNNDFRWLPNTH